MNISKNKKYKDELQGELEKTLELSKLMKKQMNSMEIIKLVAIYIAVLISAGLIWFVFYK